MYHTDMLLKIIGEGTRWKIVQLLLEYNYCVGALAKELQISEAAVSQHLKVLREAGLLTGTKKGHFMHYDVNRDLLREIGTQITNLANAERKSCQSRTEDCDPAASSEEQCLFEEKLFCEGGKEVPYEPHSDEDCCTYLR